MKAFHGNLKIKNIYLKRVEEHRKADEIIKGQYWENGKGCAVGCTIHSNNHSAYEIELGIPIILARLEDSIFEFLPNYLAITWPTRFLKAIKPGADLSKVWNKFAIWLLIDKNRGVLKHAKKDSTKEIINNVANLCRRSLKDTIPHSEWKSSIADYYSSTSDYFITSDDLPAFIDYSAAHIAYASASANLNSSDAAAYAVDTSAYAAGVAATIAKAAAYATHTGSSYTIAEAHASYAYDSAYNDAKIAQSKKLLQLLKAAK